MSSQTRTALFTANQGLIDLHHGYTDQALEKLKRAQTLDPRNPLVLDSLGYYYEKADQLNRANHYFEQAIRFNPYSAIALNNYGAFLCRNGRRRASIPYFMQAVRVADPRYAHEPYNNAKYCR